MEVMSLAGRRPSDLGSDLAFSASTHFSLFPPRLSNFLGARLLENHVQWWQLTPRHCFEAVGWRNAHDADAGNVLDGS